MSGATRVTETGDFMVTAGVASDGALYGYRVVSLEPASTDQQLDIVKVLAGGDVYRFASLSNVGGPFRAGRLVDGRDGFLYGTVQVGDDPLSEHTGLILRAPGPALLPPGSLRVVR